MSQAPDTLENGLRFGCGGLLGLVLGARAWLCFFDLNSISSFWICILSFVLVSGLLAVRYGDGFWEWIYEFLK